METYVNMCVNSKELDLAPNRTLKLSIITYPYKAGLKTLVADFDCSSFRDIKGTCSIYVKP